MSLGFQCNYTCCFDFFLHFIVFGFIFVICSDEYPDYVWDEFDKTKPMSTYLLAFFIVDFDYISNGSVRIWNRNFDPPHNTTNLAEIALKLSTHFLSVFGEYFDYPYMLPKLDIVASPDYDYGGK